MTSIRVAHAGADYEVVVGSLREALPRLASIANGVPLPIVSDERVFRLHGELLADVALPEPILVPEGEAAKDWASLAGVIASLAGLGIKRGTPIIALGGGSVGDVAGLAASLFKRGCPIIHLPTTLLAQADSAIGGKTAIDAAGQKNLVGTFQHPLLVIADPALLDTLDDRQMRSGYAEVAKYGLIDDPDFFTWCETNANELIGGNMAVRQQAIEHCIRAKARFVSADPQDTSGTRALLNLGHTFGHAIEAVAGHSILHGEAVAVGMVLAFDFSEHLGVCPEGVAARLKGHLQAMELPTRLGDLGLDNQRPQIVSAMATDKKALGRNPVLILARGIGEAFVSNDASLAEIADFLER